MLLQEGRVQVRTRNASEDKTGAVTVASCGELRNWLAGVCAGRPAAGGSGRRVDSQLSSLGA
ncbi:MAG: hypothetical protein GEV00_19460 [Actinophytocola sp.]|nr:hypothetical protein [Actinophytocola sp.]